MAKKPTVTTIASGYASTTTLNNNFEALREGFDNTLSLDGSTPNAMQADLDMDGNDILDAGSIIVGGQDLLAATQANLSAAAVAQADAEAAVTAAETSETNAATSATSASTSASNAATSASQAASSALAASGSATASATSALAAESAETNAETAETNAAASAAAALSSEIAAAASEAGVDADRVAAQAAASAAAASETAAATFETNAATSETNAAASATSASDSASAAASSAANAGSSATAASASETAAASSAFSAAAESAEATTQASNAATSATAAATSATNAATSETNAATSLTDAESARDQSQAARDTANLHKLAAEAAATSATNTAAALTGFDLSAIAETKGVTAVDVFVYDTSKDSDGGAWRKRTQGTSWYNETLNTATRGSRREFPAVAVIVAEATKVTIYDGDDPALPMWMVFTSLSSAYAVRGNVTSSAMVNGLLSVGSEGGRGVQLIDFPADYCSLYTGSFNTRSIPTIVDRNQIATFTPSGSGIVNTTVNDVAMTVLPDAPIDPATGLPVPTIAVATDGGVSVIKDDGTVVDLTYTYSINNSAFDIDIDNTGRISWGSRNINSAGTYLFVEKTIPVADKTTAPDILYTSKNISGGSLRFNALEGPYITAKTSKAIGSGGLGLTHLAENPTTPSKGMVAYTTSTYNTGWMNGDIKGAFLSDTDDTDLVGSGELVTNGTFDTDVSGWSSQIGAVITHTGSAMQVQSTGANSLAYQFITADLTKPYVISAELVSSTGGTTLLQIGGTGGLAVALSVGVNTFTIPAGRANNKLDLSPANGQTAVFDNISVKLADADRSVNNNGLTVNGTVTRSPVATGADLVGYSGFSASNYLEQPYNSDLDFGTGDFCVMGWVKALGSGGDKLIFSRSTARGVDGFGMFITSLGNIRYQIGTEGQNNSVSAYGNGWVMFCLTRTGGNAQLYVNGVLDNSDTSVFDVDVLLPMYVGGGGWFSGTNGSLSLLRISATAPTAEQIAKIYNDEKVLFQENAQATLYGSSDAVTALAHDDELGLLHVGTSAGRSVFQGLRRVSNTTTAVGTAISASNGLVVEE